MVCSKAWSNRHCEAPTCPPKPKAKELWRRQKGLRSARNDKLKFFGSIELILKDACFTKFEKSVYKAVCKIPRGETRSYAWVAKRIGRPKAARAVGDALHKNPYTIVIPCHRVVKSDGSLGGYSKGLAMKRRLLKDEGIDGVGIDCYNAIK